MPIETRSTTNPDPRPGPFLARVISHLDPSYMGGLEVELLRPVGNNEAADGQLHQVKYMSPFAGQTGVSYNNEDPDNYNNTQKSYGMWMIPPDVGTQVMVIFVDGDTRKGYWIGCVPDDNVNFSVPGLAATKYVVGDTKTLTEYERLPVAEYNKVIDKVEEDPTKISKPEHPFAKILDKQGLAKDDIRGITTSSARRETPSMVFGISTPGPTDKQEGANKGDIGKAESRIPGAFVSRLGGTTFVMDDGDDKFLRKTPASKGPPEYSSVEQGETDGDRTIPHNELVRIRTRTGHQILMHNSEDLIYIGNSAGTTWIELTSNGKIDIFASDSVSIRTKKDFNFYADRDINFEAKRNVNIKAGTEMQLETGTNYNVVVGTNGKVTIGGTMDLNVTGNYKETAARIDMNHPTPAVKALRLKTHNLPDVAAPKANISEMVSIMRRAPTAEPYPQHENLDPTKVDSTKTDRDSEGRTGAGATTAMSFSGTKYKEYTTPTDTFEKLRRPGKENTE
jgi:hypothetical protein